MLGLQMLKLAPGPRSLILKMASLRLSKRSGVPGEGVQRIGLLGDFSIKEAPILPMTGIWRLGQAQRSGMTI